MKTFAMEITPAQAAVFLEGNRLNRRLSPVYVSILAGAITRGEWTLTHQGIALDPSGRLLDGQHRCAAIVLANKPIWMNVSFDCPPDAFATMDTGRARAVSDRLAVSPRMAGIVRWLAGISASQTLSLNRVTTAQISDALPWAEPLVTAALDVCRANRRVATAYPVQAAAIIRSAMADRPNEVLAAYRDFVMLSYSNMTEGALALEKQISAGNASTKHAVQLLCKAWVAFDPNRGAKSIVVRDFTVYLDRMEAAVNHLKSRHG